MLVGTWHPKSPPRRRGIRSPATGTRGPARGDGSPEPSRAGGVGADAEPAKPPVHRRGHQRPADDPDSDESTPPDTRPTISWWDANCWVPGAPRTRQSLIITRRLRMVPTSRRDCSGDIMNLFLAAPEAAKALGVLPPQCVSSSSHHCSEAPLLPARQLGKKDGRPTKDARRTAQTLECSRCDGRVSRRRLWPGACGSRPRTWPR